MAVRNGKTLNTLVPGDRRRTADARNAWRKMSPEQRFEFVAWMFDEQAEIAIPEDNKTLARPIAIALGGGQ